MPTINLGNIISVDNKTRSVGGASGLDVEAIVNALVSVKETDLTTITDDIDLNSEKVSAISEYRILLANLQSASDFLKNPPGVDNAANNIFEYRRISASSSDGASATNYIAASTSAGATLGSYQITVDNLAVAKSATSVAYTDRDTALATLTGAGGTPKAGTFSLNGENVTIEVGDTLEDIVSKINGTTANSNVRADIIKLSDTDYRLKITSLDTGVDNAYAVAGDTTVYDSMFTGVGSVAVAAEDSEITLDGSLTITRSSNTISDAIDGVTFTLYQETPTNTLRVDILNDPTTVQTKIEEFVQAYNDIKTFIAKQQERDEDGLLLETSVLGEDDVLNNFVSSASAELANAVNGLAGDITALAAIGITFIDYEGDSENPAIANLLQIDTATLQTELDGDFDSVRALFEFQLSSTAPDRLDVYSRTNAIEITEFTVDVDFSRADGEQVQLVYVDDDGITQTLDAEYDFNDQETATSGAITDGILGATTAAGTFTTLVDGDNFRITLNNADGTTTDYDFVFMTVPGAANEFSNFNELTDAIEAVAGITASINSHAELEITPDDQFATLTFTNLTATDFKTAFGFEDTELPSGTVTGPSDSVLEGLTLIYVPNDVTDSIDVTLTQGIGDRVSNLLKTYLVEDTGLLDLKVDSLNDEEEELQTEADDLTQEISDYRDKLYNQYAALEAALAKVNSILQLLDAQDAVRNNQ